jgi:oligopeptide/dipeptide ABC transporter ATP-binding protein
MDALVAVRDLAVAYPIRRGALIPRTVGTVRAVDGVSFDIARGETLGLVGESGSGKSTVGRALLGIERIGAGSIRFGGDEITRLDGQARRSFARRMQMVFQDAYASVDPRMTVADIVAEPLVIHREGDKASRRARALELLDIVGLPERFAADYPHQLSGGQRQRVGIARALALNPEFIICDEAVSALDVSIQAQILNLLLDLQDRFGLTYLFIGHDIAVIRHMAHRTLVMYLGQVMEVGDSEALVAAPLHPYTQALMAAVPRPDPEAERLRRHDQAARSPVRAETATASGRGCPFAPRCPSVAEAARRGADCHRMRPALVAVAPGRQAACHLYAPPAAAAGAAP